MKNQVTIQELIEKVQDAAGSDDEAVQVIQHMMKTGRAVLSKTRAAKIIQALAA